MNYIELRGKELIQKGFSVIPIKDGYKHPDFPKWQHQITSDFNQLEKWVSIYGKTHNGVGIGTGLQYGVAGLDVDIYNKELADKIELLIRKRYPNIVYRCGLPPKKMYIFRLTEEMPSRCYIKYEDENGIRNQVEIIGKNKQFVAFATHPDTNKPYQWSDDVPLVKDLPVLTSELIYDVVELVQDYISGVTKPKNNDEEPDIPFDDYDDIFANDFAVKKMDIDEAHEIFSVLLKDLDTDHDTWRDIGFALWHQFDGSKAARELFFQLWEEKTGNPIAEKYRKIWTTKWKSFNPDTYGDRPITMATFIKKAAPVLHGRYLHTIEHCQTTQEFVDVIQKVARVQFDAISMEELFECAVSALNRIKGGKVKYTKTTIQRLIESLRLKNISENDMPLFVHNFCYDAIQDSFFSLTNHVEYKRQSFDLMFAQNVSRLNVKNITASTIALTVGNMRKVNGRGFNPTMGKFFRYDEVSGKAIDLTQRDTNTSFLNGDPERVLVNTFVPDLHPEIPENYTKYGKYVADSFKELVEHIVPPENLETVFQWLAWQVQFFGIKRKWCLMIVGRQGDGKSLIGRMVMQAIGMSYCKPLNTNDINTRYNDWIDGLIFGVVEEYELTGSKGKENYETIKTYVTEPLIRGESKYEKRATIANFANLMFVANKDGTTGEEDQPYFERDDRRFFYIRTRIHDHDEFSKFKAENPQFLAKFNEIAENPEKNAKWVRKFLAEYPISKEFMTTWDSPMTKDKAELLDLNHDDDVMDLRKMLQNENSPLGRNKDLFDLTGYLREVGASQADMKSQKWRKVMQDFSMSRIAGRLHLNGVRHTVYSQTPKKWQVDGNTMKSEVRDILVKLAQDDVVSDEDIWESENLADFTIDDL